MRIFTQVHGDFRVHSGDVCITSNMIGGVSEIRVFAIKHTEMLTGKIIRYPFDSFRMSMLAGTIMITNQARRVDS